MDNGRPCSFAILLGPNLTVPFLTDRRHEKSWNDPPMFSMEQLNNASNTVPLSKRYRYPQTQAPAQGQMYQQQQQPNYGGASAYGYPGQPAATQQNNVPPSYGQQPQQYPAYSPYGGPNAGAQAATNYQAAPNVSQLPAQQQYSQFGTSQAGASVAPNAYPTNLAPFGSNPASQPNYNASQYANNAASYNASQFAGQFPPGPPQPMNPNYQQPQPPYNRY